MSQYTPRHLAFIMSLACSLVAVSEPVLILSTPQSRHAFYRNETPVLMVQIENHGEVGLPVGTLRLEAGGVLSMEKSTGEVSPGATAGFSFDLPLLQLSAGSYTFTARYETPSANATAEAVITTVHRPNPDHLMVWLWGGGGSQWYLDHGFTTWTGPGWGSAYTGDEWGRALDQGLLAGADVGISPNGGLRDVDPKQIADPDATNLAVRPHETGGVANPFHPEVARIQDDANRKLMEFVQHFPQVKTAFFNTEIVDGLEVNRNTAGKRLVEETFGADAVPAADPIWVAPGVIADTDPAYLQSKFKYQQGNGLSLANARTAEMVRRYRPDILTITDPYREAGYLNLFSGVGAASTWTYTNPDPKLMLYIETLRAACWGSEAIPLHTITLLNYPGQLAPTDEWMLTGPARTTVCTWINLSRAPKAIGYYYSSECNPESGDSVKVPLATSEKIRELSDTVFKPYGPFLTQADIAPRRIAVLSSMAAAVHGKSPSLLGGYSNYQVYHFYTLLAMNHWNADVLLDETVERYGLDGYDVLVLPKCDVLTESVYKAVQAFQRRGGLVIADQYLGPESPGALRFDFDFTYRNKVSANAIAKNIDFANWNDQLKPGTAEVQQVTGVTALDDQRIMEDYAAQLKQALAGKLSDFAECDTPRVLTNMLEKDGAKYLVLVNDNRTYGERVGEKYKAELDKLLPISTTVTLNTWPHETLAAFDMLNRRALNAEKGSDGRWHFPVNLDERGGTIIALYPRAPERLRIVTPPTLAAGIDNASLVFIEDGDGVPLAGLQPIRIDITTADGASSAYSGYYCARNGVLRLPLVPGLNESGQDWNIVANDLTAGLKGELGVHVSNAQPPQSSLQ